MEVEELPILSSVEGKVKEGSKIKIKIIDCKRLDCENYDICHNPAVEENKDYKISKVIGEMNCKINKNLMKVELSEI